MADLVTTADQWVALARGVARGWLDQTTVSPGNIRVSLLRGAVAASIEQAVAALPFVPKLPGGPVCDLKAFGDKAVDFAEKFRGKGVDGGASRHMSPAMFAIWTTCRDHGVAIPHPLPKVAHLG